MIRPPPISTLFPYTTLFRSSRADGRLALVSITDTGIGIPQDEIGHVFERFRRVRSGAAQSIPGTGLGLTIVKQIVEMHGGKRSEEHTSELQSHSDLVCRLLL